jgi:hypothetical protein
MLLIYAETGRLAAQGQADRRLPPAIGLQGPPVSVIRPPHLSPSMLSAARAVRWSRRPQITDQ